MRTRINKLALLLSLLALGTLGLVASGVDADDQTTAASETKTARDELAADNKADYKPCGYFDRYKFAVEGDVSCHRARRVLRAFSHPRPLPGSWRCGGKNGDARWRCVNEPGARIKAWVTCHDRSPCPGWIKRAVAKRHHRH